MYIKISIDRNGIMCDNIIELMPYICTVLMGLTKDPTSEEADGNVWDMPWWVKILIGLGTVFVGALVTAFTAGTGISAVAAFGSALLSSTVQVGISAGISAGIGGIMSLISGDGFLDGLLDGLVDGVMWGGIFAGGAQILSGVFKKYAQIANRFGRLKDVKKSPLFSPDRLKSVKEIVGIARKGQVFYDYGGTIIRFGHLAHIDVSTKSFLHLAIFKFNHVPIGAIIAGILGGFL